MKSPNINLSDSIRSPFLPLLHYHLMIALPIPIFCLPIRLRAVTDLILSGPVSSICQNWPCVILSLTTPAILLASGETFILWRVLKALVHGLPLSEFLLHCCYFNCILAKKWGVRVDLKTQTFSHQDNGLFKLKYVPWSRFGCALSISLDISNTIHSPVLMYTFHLHLWWHRSLETNPDRVFAGCRLS